MCFTLQKTHLKLLSKKNVIRLQHTQNIQHLDPVIPLLGIYSKKVIREGLPGGTVVKNPPANAGDSGSSPGPGRSHMPWSNLRPCTTTTEPAL